MTMDRYSQLFPRGDDAAELAAAEKGVEPCRASPLGLYR
jgi:hypothetical protein